MPKLLGTLGPPAPPSGTALMTADRLELVMLEYVTGPSVHSRVCTVRVLSLVQPWFSKSVCMICLRDTCEIIMGPCIQIIRDNKAEVVMTERDY